MKAEQHPEYAAERTKLDNTIQGIERRLQDFDPSKSVSAADQRSAVNIYRENKLKYENLQQARKEPYFGRVDWQPASAAEPEVFYVAKISIPALEIYSWRDTTPATLYYDGFAQGRSTHRPRRRGHHG